MIESYGPNGKARADARASLLNHYDPDHYSVHQVDGQWCVVPKTRLEEVDVDEQPDEELEHEPEDFDPREEWGTMPRLRGNGRGQL